MINYLLIVSLRRSCNITWRKFWEKELNFLCCGCFAVWKYNKKRNVFISWTALTLSHTTPDINGHLHTTITHTTLIPEPWKAFFVSDVAYKPRKHKLEISAFAAANVVGGVVDGVDVGDGVGDVGEVGTSVSLILVARALRQTSETFPNGSSSLLSLALSGCINLSLRCCHTFRYVWDPANISNVEWRFHAEVWVAPEGHYSPRETTKGSTRERKEKKKKTRIQRTRISYITSTNLVMNDTSRW